jgi:RES domain-containing protein
LAALEVIVHHGGIPGDYQVILIDMPDALPIESIERGDLPETWPDPSTDRDTEVRGDMWAVSLRTPVLKVPSAVILSEHNYILNPRHPEFAKIRFEVLATEYVDRRLRR